jgi:hypothetical protein
MPMIFVMAEQTPVCLFNGNNITPGHIGNTGDHRVLGSF